MKKITIFDKLAIADKIMSEYTNDSKLLLDVEGTMMKTVKRHTIPTGQWIRYSNYLICSHCGQYLDPNKILDVCPTCGADMRGREE